LKPKDYIARRQVLKQQIKTGIILLCGNISVPRNYAGNPYAFRQDSTFLYYTGIDIPHSYLIIDCDKDEEILFGDDPGIDDQIWSGIQKSMYLIANISGIHEVLPVSELKNSIFQFIKNRQKIHYLPPYPYYRQIYLSELLNITVSEVLKNYSVEFIQAVVHQRSIKSEQEINEIEHVLTAVTRPIHLKALEMAHPGIYEYEIVAEMNKILKEHDLDYAYSPICSVHGEILHNESHRNKLNKEQLLLIDAGAESTLHYASDITRTFPVGGRFTIRQKEIYDLVLSVEQNTIEKITPGTRYLDLHKDASIQIAKGLIELDLMKGDPEEAVKEGAHTLFFPHGLGHMMGLDVHDMEDLGENFVGYDKNTLRSNQFGTTYLRLARSLQTGFVLTVEPGIYFIPTLIDLWRSEKKYEKYINYPNVETYKNFGGIRIEDNVLVESKGCRILGSPIPKSRTEIENLMSVRE